MSEVVVRPALPADAGRIATLYAHYVRESTTTFEIDPPGAGELAHRMESVRTLGLPYLVAESGGELAGYGYATQFRPRAAYRFTVEDSVYVAPHLQRRGVGGLLLSRLLEDCRHWGARQVIGAIGGDNPASIGLHTAHGFHVAGVLRRVGWKFDRWLDVTLMQREL